MPGLQGEFGAAVPAREATAVFALAVPLGIGKKEVEVLAQTL